MPQEFKAEEVELKAKKDTKASSYGILNTMTIDQLKRAKGVLNAKLKDNKTMSAETRTKIENMLGEYNRTERQIGKYWQTVTRHPNGKSLLAANGKTLKNLTIQNIKGLTAEQINNKDLGKINRGYGRKFALGAGIALVAGGAGCIGPKEAFLIKKLFDLLTGASWNNQLAVALIGAGGALIGISALAKKIGKWNEAKNKEQAEVNAAENEAFEEASKGEEQVINSKMSPEEISSLANEISQNPDLTDHYMKIVQLGEDDLGNKYSLQQRRNFLEALREVEKSNKEFAEAARNTKNGEQLGVETATIKFENESTNTNTANINTTNTNTTNTNTTNTNTTNTNTTNTNTANTNTTNTNTTNTNTTNTNTANTTAAGTSVEIQEDEIVTELPQGVKVLNERLNELLIVRGYTQTHVDTMQKNVEQFEQQIDQAVAAGQLSQAEAERMKAKVKARQKEHAKVSGKARNHEGKGVAGALKDNKKLKSAQEFSEGFDKEWAKKHPEAATMGG